MGLFTLLAFGLALYLGHRFGAEHAIRALGNPAVARFTREQDGPRGVTVYQVTPARPAYAVLALALLPIPFGLFFPPLWLFSLVFLGFALIGAKHRVPATLTVGNGRLEADAGQWPLADLASVSARKNSRAGEQEVGTVVSTSAITGRVSGAKPTSALIGKALGTRMAERSWVLAVRPRSGSDTVIIAGGLTEDVAVALQDDLRQTIDAERTRATGAAPTS